jgi:hypothetical protein
LPHNILPLLPHDISAQQNYYFILLTTPTNIHTTFIGDKKNYELNLLKSENHTTNLVDPSPYHQQQQQQQQPTAQHQQPPISHQQLSQSSQNNHQNSSQVVTKHVTAPIDKPQSSNPLPPGQNICADCERLIV